MLDASSYGDQWAQTYDEVHPEATKLQLEKLAALSSGGPVLEMGVGTGRIAVPLAGLGIPVTGLDSSEAMLAVLRKKPGGQRVETVKGDFRTVRLERQFPLVLMVMGTLSNALTQDDQMASLATARAHLVAGGRLLIEGSRPNLSAFVDEQAISIKHIKSNGDMLVDILLHDALNQRIVRNQLSLVNGVLTVLPVVTRYTLPAELDLMAKCSGLALETRWSDWSEAAYHSRTRHHISIYRPL